MLGFVSFFSTGGLTSHLVADNSTTSWNVIINKKQKAKLNKIVEHITALNYCFTKILDTFDFKNDTFQKLEQPLFVACFKIKGAILILENWQITGTIFFSYNV